LVAQVSMLQRAPGVQYTMQPSDLAQRTEQSPRHQKAHWEEPVHDAAAPLATSTRHVPKLHAMLHSPVQSWSHSSDPQRGRAVARGAGAASADGASAGACSRPEAPLRVQSTPSTPIPTPAAAMMAAKIHHRGPALGGAALALDGFDTDTDAAVLIGCA